MLGKTLPKVTQEGREYWDNPVSMKEIKSVIQTSTARKF